MLDSLEKTKGMHLQDESDFNYNAYNHEIVQEELRVRAQKNISIKFNKKYSTQRKIKGIVFSDIILDFDEYSKSENKEKYYNRKEIKIEI